MTGNRAGGGFIMKWIAISFFSTVILLSIMFAAGFEFIGIDFEGPPATAQALPLATR
jgi:hypothetical protein